MDISSCIIIVSLAMTTTAALHPLILVPGAGGNQLEAKLSGAEYKPTSFLCKLYPLKKDSWFRLWFDPTVLFPPFTKCFNHRMKLYYHPHLDDYYNAPGVHTRVTHFGSTNSLLYLHPNLRKITAYMAPLVNALQEFGYKDGTTLFGAPYDFRYGLAAQGHPTHIASKFLNDLKQLIETASNSSGGKPVILLSHSLGGLYALQLLNRNPKSWTQKYIKHLIALSTPWGGTVGQMLTFASGNTLGVPLVNPLLVREEQRSCESNMWLLPSPKVFGATKLVITPHAAYSAHDIPKFLDDIGFSQGVLPYTSRILPLTHNLTLPDVPVTCIIGTGVKTPETLFYGDGEFDKGPEIVYGDGDGTVNMVSLLALESEWANKSHQQPLEVTKLLGVSQTDILKHDIALNKILEHISCINSRNATPLVSNT